MEYAHFLLARVEKNSDLGAFISVFADHLLASASRATRELYRGDEVPLLHGIPVSAKDLIFTKGFRTTLGSLYFKDHLPEKDSIAIERLKAAGAIIFAKSNTSEFGMYRRTINLVSREAVNPWDKARTAGGSSGGAAAAVAAGLGPLALGTDGGGSIRNPSAFNGVFGIFPSRRRIPNGAGYWDSGNSGIGPITRDVRDGALLMSVMAASDTRDPFSMPLPPPDYLAELDKGVEGVRIAWSADLGRNQGQDEAVVRRCHEGAQVLKTAGAIYSEPSFRLEEPQDAMELDPEYSIEKMEKYFLSVDKDYVSFAAWMATLSRQDISTFSVYVRNLGSGTPTATDYAMSIPPHIRNRAKVKIDDLFNTIDLLLCPTIGHTAFICNESSMSTWEYKAYSYIVNVSGYCAASVPIGFVNGLPVGLQIIGRPNEEDLVLRAARVIEIERPWAQYRPF